jgi:hypothetical protein
MEKTNCFDGKGEWVQYRNRFNNPHIPTRMRNAIESELNAEVIGSTCILPIPQGVDPRVLIPNWLIILWAEMELLQRLPNIGAGTINDTLQVIADSLKE